MPVILAYKIVIVSTWIKNKNAAIHCIITTRGSRKNGKLL